MNHESEFIDNILRDLSEFASAPETLIRSLLAFSTADNIIRDLSAFSAEQTADSLLRDLLDFSRPKESATARWIREQGPRFQRELVAYLDKNLPRSKILGKNEDHVSKFLEDLLRRDAIGKREKRGDKTYISQVKAWCLRNAHTQNRDAGNDALSRCMHGALTRKEWTSKDRDVSWTEISQPRTFVTDEIAGLGVKDDQGVEKSSIDFLVSSEAPDQGVEGNVDDLLEQFSGVFDMSMTPEERRLHMKILRDFFVEQYRASEISEKYGIETTTVSAAVTRIRRILRRAKEKGAFQEYGLS